MNKIIILIAIFIITAICTYFILNKKSPNTPTPIDVSNISEFDYKMIKQTHNYYSKENYMISPLSIAFALSMVRDGANGNTKEEIVKLLGDYKLNNKVNIKDKVGIANLIFIKNTYKNDVSKDYISKLQKEYDSDVLFDDFYTPDAINNWVSDKTFKMINNAVDNISPDFVLGLANAIAIDVEWKSKFECNNTRSEEFTKEDNTIVNTAMMHSSNDVVYIESDNAKGIIKDYAVYNKSTGEKAYEANENTIALEYIAILPNKSIDEYIKILDKNELNTLLSNKKEPSQKLDINLSLPKYTYDFDYKKFQESLIELGMKDAFSPISADFSNIIDSKSDLEIYINKSIHKTHIELSENGTKASAVTIFIFDKNSVYIPEEKEEINIDFNRPFIYIIKEKGNDNIWFFGTVYEPLKWEDNSGCKYE